MSKSPEQLKAEILRLTREYSALMHQANRPAYEIADAARSARAVESSQNGSRPPTQQPSHPATQQPSAWQPGQTIPYAGRVFNQDEVEAAVGSTLDFWLTLGPEGEAFEKELAALLGVKYSLLVNSGSSANLVAISALTTHKLPTHKRIVPGDEVITVAAGFPTTVAPILQVGAVPVFLDNDPVSGNIRAEQLESAYVAGKTKAVMLAHALGNPFDLGAVLEFCRKYDLWLIEDNCDALGCTYSMPVALAKALGGLDHLLKLAAAGKHPMIRFEHAEKLKTENLKSDLLASPSSDISASQPFKISASSATLLLTAPTGTWGDLSTQSFYPPHHLTMGEGGAVNIVSRPALKTYAESFRDWGRDCWCASGKDDTCGKRFQWQLGELPKGYDHKYIYSHLGYNLKPLDPQAAIGRQQLKKLPAFIEARKYNWETLRAGLADLEEFFDFTLPTHATRWIPPEERKNAEKLKTENLKSDLSASPAPNISASQPFRISASSSESVSAFDFESCFEWDSSGCRTDTSWFGFMLRVKPTAPFSHSDLAHHLNEQKIGNRMFFGGNLLRQPAFVQLRRDRPAAIRVVSAQGQALSSGELELKLRASTNGEAASPLPGADAIMNQALFLGTYPGLSPAMLDFTVHTLVAFASRK
jgi:CDP-6-deoxy-D-xylo-4-hexulose-3-dehydrase